MDHSPISPSTNVDKVWAAVHRIRAILDSENNSRIPGAVLALGLFPFGATSRFQCGPHAPRRFWNGMRALAD